MHCFISDFLNRFRRRIANKWVNARSRRFWAEHPLLSNAEVHRRISDAIKTNQPFSVARLGGVEASILIWAMSETRLLDRFFFPFSSTNQGATNAGVRPRYKSSYRFFAELCSEALDGIDLQGVWRTAHEAVCLKHQKTAAYFDLESAGPEGKNDKHWLCAVKGKKVLVVSPFSDSINFQIPLLCKVWPCMNWMDGTNFVVEPFPYLIDDECPEAWWDVYSRIGRVVSRGDYDVALFGCGGLGLPFAHLAKKSGRMGIHMGGHLQMVFGIYGERHLHQSWFRNQINCFWKRPNLDEVPKSAKRVEGGCYW